MTAWVILAAHGVASQDLTALRHSSSRVDTLNLKAKSYKNH